MHERHFDRRGKRSRLLGSIFAHAPHGAPLSGKSQSAGKPQSSSRAASDAGNTGASIKPFGRRGWRDVTGSLTRTAIAEMICARFFLDPRRDDRAMCAGRLDGGMATAGQRLQALSTERHEGESSGIDLVALLRGLARDGGAAAASRGESAGASPASLQTAKAA